MFFVLMESFVELKSLLNSVAGKRTADGFILVLCAFVTALIMTVFVVERERFLRFAAMARCYYGRRPGYDKFKCKSYIGQ